MRNTIEKAVNAQATLATDASPRSRKTTKPANWGALEPKILWSGFPPESWQHALLN